MFVSPQLSKGSLNGERDSMDAIITRHRFALQQVVNALQNTRDGLQTGAEPELVLVDMCAARGALVSITSRVDTEGILTRFFSTFCPGK